MKRWHWVRHAPTHQKTFTGWRDVPADLSDASALRRLAKALPSDAVFVSSDLQRAVTTTDAIAGNRRRLPNEHGLREIHFGDWDGLHFSEVSARDEALSRAFWETPGDHAPPGGESWNQTSERVNAVVRRLNNIDAQDIVMVAHFGVILTQLQRTLAVSPAAVLAHRIDPLSLTTLRPDDSVAECINRLP